MPRCMCVQNLRVISAFLQYMYREKSDYSFPGVWDFDTVFFLNIFILFIFYLFYFLFIRFFLIMMSDTGI